jgi:HEPN superfamily RiboL-PSP-like protein
MSNEHVQRLMDDHNTLLEYLSEQQELSLMVVVEASFPKIALLASASDLERRIEELLVLYFQLVTKDSSYAVSFVRNKAIKRQFHTYFNWPDKSANQFFGLFGEDFKRKMKELIAEDTVLAQAIRDFCEIGDLRNQLVHQGYASFTMQKTAAEVFELYKNAIHFVDKLSEVLHKF